MKFYIDYAKTLNAYDLCLVNTPFPRVLVRWEMVGPRDGAAWIPAISGHARTTRPRDLTNPHKLYHLLC